MLTGKYGPTIHLDDQYVCQLHNMHCDQASCGYIMRLYVYGHAQ